jgi:hypothetical protein
MHSIPLRQFDRDSVGTGQKKKIAIVEAFKFAAHMDSIGSEVLDSGRGGLGNLDRRISGFSA